MIPIIDKGIAESENSIFAISGIWIEEHGITDEDWRAMLMINKEEQRFIVDHGYDWTFRRPRS